MHNIKTHSLPLGEHELTFETGKLAHLADGSVLVRHGDFAILGTAGMSDTPRAGISFFPLMCDFQTKYYATGKIKGSRFLKREGRPSDNGVLLCRLMDRPLRPLFNKKTTNDIQIIATLLSADTERSVAPYAIIAASMAVQLSGIPIEAPVGAVRVGMREDGEYFLDPTHEEIEKGKLDLIVAGTEDAIMMVEAGANLISDEEMLSAFEFAHKHIKTICQAQAAFRDQHEITAKVPLLRVENEAATDAVDSVLTEADYASLGGAMKKEYKQSVKKVETKLLDALADRIEAAEFSKGDLLGVMGKRAATFMRDKVFAQGIRLDGRKADEVRQLYTEVGLLPRTHGSALFQRGDTQALSVLTIGGPSEEQLIDEAEQAEYGKRYIHHYNFPPYSVGEVRPLRGTGRREIGHGCLAERALRYVMPKKEENFPYMVRVVSEILACNGSSSMASVCGSTLSLMDGGVPIKAPIAGVAMGLVMNEEGEYVILTDIQGAEDFDGDMDLKVTGDENGLTALQMDIKLKGLDLNLLREALAMARTARQTILANMKAVIAAPREAMSEYAPRVISFTIEPDQIGAVIGKGGETIQGICAEYEVKIDIEDDGTVCIAGKGDQATQAQGFIANLLYEPEEGDVFEKAVVKTITAFGAFVEYLPGKEALVHISQIADKRIEKVEDVLSLNEVVRVKYTGKDKMGRPRFSIKDAQ
jgi:polyribonucleotide nucleotidyltransferase